MTRQQLNDWLAERDLDQQQPHLLLLTEEHYDAAFLGVTERDGLAVAVYDARKCVEALVSTGMSYEDAEEWFEFNTRSAYVGPTTPIFVDSPAAGDL